MTSKLESHTTYKDAEGNRVPSVTTILGILAKPQLIPWAFNLGKEGKDMKAVQDSAMSTGTLLHYLVASELRGQSPEQSYLDEFSKRDRDHCDNCLLKWYEFTKDKSINPILIEAALVSEKFKYGGTLDLLAEINGKLWLCDIKSSNAVYIDNWFQLAAYDELLTSDYPIVEEFHILRFGKDESLDFEDARKTNLDKEFELFIHCKEIYEIQKQLRRDK